MKRLKLQFVVALTATTSERTQLATHENDTTDKQITRANFSDDFATADDSSSNVKDVPNNSCIVMRHLTLVVNNNFYIMIFFFFFCRCWTLSVLGVVHCSSRHQT